MQIECRYTPTSPLSPKLSGKNRPMSAQAGGVQRPGQVRKPGCNLNMALPRYHPSNFNQSNSGAAASPVIQGPALTLNRSTQPIELDSPKVMREKHQEFLNSVRLSAKAAALPFGQKPGSPRLDPLGSPKGPVTPLRTMADSLGGRSPHRIGSPSKDDAVSQQQRKTDIS
ncbi:hypothetical protein DV736_g440, partial [Chaetothyriales sp. CBS 134916]